MAAATVQTPMSVQAVAARSVELCNQGRNFDVMRTVYSPDIVSVEGSGEETVSQTAVIQKSERWVAVNTERADHARPVLSMTLAAVELGLTRPRPTTLLIQHRARSPDPLLDPKMS